MIYIIIDHINGEFQDVFPQYIEDFNLVKKYILEGYLVISIDKKNNIVKEIH